MNKFLSWIAVILVVAGGAWLLLRSPQQSSALDSFAQCLADKGATMYGADWCPHCQNEKRAFGGSFKYVPYVECPDDPKRCTAMGIEGYPTWVMSDGRKLVGEQGLTKLADESGCVLSQ